LYNFTIFQKKGEKMGFGTILAASFITTFAFIGLVYYFMMNAGSEA